MGMCVWDYERGHGWIWMGLGVLSVDNANFVVSAVICNYIPRLCVPLITDIVRGFWHVPYPSFCTGEPRSVSMSEWCPRSGPQPASVGPVCWESPAAAAHPGHISTHESWHSPSWCTADKTEHGRWHGECSIVVFVCSPYQSLCAVAISYNNNV